MSATTTGLDHPAIDAITAVETGLTALADAPLWSLPTAELAAIVVRTERLARRLDAALVTLTNQADVMGVAEHQGATSLPAWLRAVTDVPISETKARLRLHQALSGRKATAAAFDAGDISRAGAAAVCESLSALPAAVSVELTTEIERLLVETAADEGTRAVVGRASEIIHRFAPDQLEATEEALRETNALVLAQRHDGTLSIRGRFDPEAAALALSVLGAHATPAPTTDGTPDFRDAPTRYADAFVRVLQLASTASPTTNGQVPHISVAISLDSLSAVPGTPPGRLDTGATISAAAVRRLACDAQIIPVVLGTTSEPLDIGRASRTWPVAIRRAIEVRDHGCTMPGCDRPSAWCDTHHLTG